MNDAIQKHQRTAGLVTAGRFPVRRLVIAVRRHIGLCAGVLAAVVALAMAVTALQEPVFEAAAEVVVDAGNQQGLPASPGTGVARSAVERADGEVRVIRSRELARRVAAALRLDRDPAFDRPNGFTAEAARMLGRIRGERDPGGAPIEPGAAAAHSIARLLDGLSVDRPDDTLSLMIGYAAADPATAARVANEFARQYTELARRPGARPSVRIISEAEPPLAPVSPRLLRRLLLAILAGLGFGVVGALLAERWFGGLTNGADIESRFGLRHLGSVPLLASVLPQADSAPQAILQAPRSGFAETFRNLLQAIDHADGRRARVVGITSALAGEGKTTVAICLARTIALRGERVVLIDCDARGGGLGAMFGGAGKPGLTEVLRGDATLDEALVHDEASGACILPIAASAAGGSGVSDTLAMAALIEDLRRRFEHVLIDNSAVLPAAEARTIAALADMLIVLVRWRSTADKSLKETLRLLGRENARIGGIVLSFVDLRKQAKYAQGDASFYYGQYSKYYS